ncbi:MAG: FAD-dependent oxidoreductase [Gammaproteobacteria bacterium]|nr:FAD-dependent oxidoreductase [Gammaproteobacteria bacterium]
MSYPGAEFDVLTQGFLKPTNYVNPEPKSRYHLVVIGAGPAGLITAIGAAGIGAKVALIERHQMGGDCLNVGCIPSKALLEFTKHHTHASFDEAFSWLREVRAGIAPHDSVERYSQQGVDVFLGDARFNAAGAITVDGIELAGRRIVICTGAAASIPPIPGLREAAPLTNEDVFDLTQKPASIAILGAGAIGCEMATVFARLGVVVHLFELAQRVLPLEIEQASETVALALVELGVHLHLGQGVSSVERNDNFIVKRGDAKSGDLEAGVEVEQVLVALGRTPNTADLNLVDAGVEIDARGFISTDTKLRTSNKTIYAAGDCTATLQFTHHADAQARAVIQNALFLPTVGVDGLVIPHCTYTQPEVASVGPSPQQLSEQGIEVDELEFDFEDLDRGRAEIRGAGFVRVYLKRGSDQILSATIVGHDAGEQIAPICLLMSNGLGLRAAGKAIIAYPTRAEYIKRLADAYNRTRFTPRVAWLFKFWLKLRS